MNERATTINQPQHNHEQPFEIRDNCLCVGGETITELAARMGSEPFYAYDRRIIQQRVKTLRAALPASVHLHYAIKANPMPELVTHMAQLTDGLDVASAGELAIATRCGLAPTQISFAGPGKSDADLVAAVTAGVIINLESEGEMHRVADIAHELHCRPPVAVRVNPDFELKTSGLKMSGGAKPFGVDAERVPALLLAMAELPLEFVGFHIYCGGQNLQADSLIEAQRKTFELAFRLAACAPATVRWLNIGGGFGVPYFPGEKPLQIEPIAKALEALVAEAAIRLPQAELVLELGRYLVAPAGLYICRVVDRKQSRGETFLVTNGGMHQHLAASGNFGQVIRKNYPIAIANRVVSTTTEEVSIVGPLCTPLDLLASKMRLPLANVGDYVAIFQSGAYGFSASPQRFLSHPAAGEVLV